MFKQPERMPDKQNKSSKAYDAIVRDYIIENWDRIVMVPNNWDQQGIPFKVVKRELQDKLPRNRIRAIMCRKYCTCSNAHPTTIESFTELTRGTYVVPKDGWISPTRGIPTIALNDTLTKAFHDKYCPEKMLYEQRWDCSAFIGADDV